MSKYPLILSIAVLLVCIRLSGCVSEESKFIGTWKHHGEEPGTNITFTCFDNGEIQIESYASFHGTWYLNDSQFIILLENGDINTEPQIADYEFSDGGNTLTLIAEVNEIPVVYTKQ